MWRMSKPQLVFMASSQERLEPQTNLEIHMKATVTIPFGTVNQKFKPGDTVTIEEVGSVLFYACTSAKRSATEPKKSEPQIVEQKD
jgi:hypothetical protein